MNSQTFWKCASVSAAVGLFYLGRAIYSLSESPDFGWERQAYAQTTAQQRERVRQLFPHKWERVNKDPDHIIWRHRVPGGWIVHVHHQGLASGGAAFVPNGRGTWQFDREKLKKTSLKKKQEKK